LVPASETLFVKCSSLLRHRCDVPCPLWRSRKHCTTRKTQHKTVWHVCLRLWQNVLALAICLCLANATKLWRLCGV